MASVEFMGGESASKTNPENSCSGKSQINYSYCQSDVSTGTMCRMHAPERPWIGL